MNNKADGLLYAPWTDAQVAGLNRYQNCNFFHPYTCCIDSGHGPLEATRGGWICKEKGCTYTQIWAHPWTMLSKSKADAVKDYNEQFFSVTGKQPNQER